MKRTIALLALCGIVSHSLSRSTYPILLPAVEDDLAMTHQGAGLLTTVNFAAYMAGVAIVTTFGGRYEPARVLRWGLAVAAIGFAILYGGGGFGSLSVGQAITGLASAAIWMTAPALATAVVDPGRRGLVMGLLSSTMGVGIVTISQGTRLARQAAGDEQLWRPVWLVAALYTAVLLLAVLVALRTPPTAPISGGISLARLRTVPGWKALATGHVLFALVISAFPPFFGAALEADGFSRAHVTNLYSLFGLAAIAAAVGLGRISDRVGRRPVLAGAMVVCALSAGLVVVGAEPLPTIAAVLFGGASFTFPVLIATYLTDHLSDRAFSNAFGALTMMYGLALVIGPFIAGTIGDSSLGFDVVFIGVAVCSLLSAAAISRLPTIAAPTAKAGDDRSRVS